MYSILGASDFLLYPVFYSFLVCRDHFNDITRLQSRNTKHYWHIIHQQYPSFVSCKIQHKHRQDVPFHEQGNAPTLEQAIDRIKAHDFYHLYVRPMKKANRSTDQKGRIPAWQEKTEKWPSTNQQGLTTSASRRSRCRGNGLKKRDSRSATISRSHARETGW